MAQPVTITLESDDWIYIQSALTYSTGDLVTSGADLSIIEKMGEIHEHIDSKLRHSAEEYAKLREDEGNLDHLV